MAEQKAPRVKLPPVEQIGIVVEDMDKAIEYYSSVFGWGPFEVRDFGSMPYTYRGQVSNAHLKLAFAKSGPLEIELIQVLEGETPHTEFLKRRGEGIQHLRFHVDDLDGMLADLAKDGIRPVWGHKVPQLGISFAYLDSDQIGGVMFELIEDKNRQGG